MPDVAAPLARVAQAGWLPRLLALPQGRFLVATSPVVVAFLMTEWAVMTGTASFTAVLAFIGVNVVALLAGIFPVLLLIASRRKGEYVPRPVYRLLGNR